MAANLPRPIYFQQPQQRGLGEALLLSLAGAAPDFLQGWLQQRQQNQQQQPAQDAALALLSGIASTATGGELATILQAAGAQPNVEQNAVQNRLPNGLPGTIGPVTRGYSTGSITGAQAQALIPMLNTQQSRQEEAAFNKARLDSVQGAERRASQAFPLEQAQRQEAIRASQAQTKAEAARLRLAEAEGRLIPARQALLEAQASGERSRAALAEREFNVNLNKTIQEGVATDLQFVTAAASQLYPNLDRRTAEGLVKMQYYGNPNLSREDLLSLHRTAVTDSPEAYFGAIKDREVSPSLLGISTDVQNRVDAKINELRGENGQLLVSPQAIFDAVIEDRNLAPEIKLQTFTYLNYLNPGSVVLTQQTQKKGLAGFMEALGLGSREILNRAQTGPGQAMSPFVEAFRQAKTGQVGDPNASAPGMTQGAFTTPGDLLKSLGLPDTVFLGAQPQRGNR